ncbi:hypothetical protein LNQ49_18445 [Flavobacterium sp. F-65]|uniref:Uncharacterized protein n=1 Tax=Flavobacterium pisciphilum TaxID=2893755 RepID=A0ABS8MXQ2_9FLAO|nr:hypothetical protein [Flavobacterium sp. F-65]MCC9073561.1 hypothetical protein [Flavobacterium sp. F-65]
MFEIFSTREIALIIWSSMFFIATIFWVKPKAVFNLFIQFFNYRIQVPLWLMFGYIAGITLIFYNVGIWNIDLLKDTIIWSVTSAAILFFNINKAKDTAFFLPILLENIKAIVLLEFVTNFYTFSFTIEMFIIPIITFIGVLQIAAEHSSKTNAEHLKAAGCLKNIFSATGALVFIYVGYKTFIAYNDLLTIQNVKSLLLPIVFTFLLLPFLYFLALYMNYEILFLRMPYLIDDKREMRKMKLNILLMANINLNKLHKISKNLNYNTYEKHEIRESLRKILNGINYNSNRSSK